MNLKSNDAFNPNIVLTFLFTISNFSNLLIFPFSHSSDIVPMGFVISPLNPLNMFSLCFNCIYFGSIIFSRHSMDITLHEAPVSIKNPVQF